MVNLINITYHDITDMHIHVTMVIYSVRVNQLIISKFRLCCCPHGRCKKPGQGHQDATLWWRWRGSTTTLWTVLTSRERRCSRSDAHTLQKELSHVESLVYTVFCRICVADLLDSTGRKWYANIHPQHHLASCLYPMYRMRLKMFFMFKYSSMLFWYHCYLLQSSLFFFKWFLIFSYWEIKMKYCYIY